MCPSAAVTEWIPAPDGFCWLSGCPYCPALAGESHQSWILGERIVQTSRCSAFSRTSHSNTPFWFSQNQLMLESISVFVCGDQITLHMGAVHCPCMVAERSYKISNDYG
jgi:hypothetical protein